MMDFFNLRHVSDLMYYDGPLLSVYADEMGFEHLVFWVDQNDDYNTWLTSKCGKK